MTARYDGSFPPLVQGLIDELWWSPQQPSEPPAPLRSDSSATADLSSRVNEALQRATYSTDGGAFSELRGQDALDEARVGARPGGALEEVIVGVKELIAVKGLRCRGGSNARADALPEPRDAELVRAMKAHGALVLGSTAMHELAFGTTGINLACGSVRNPVDRDRICGGSSSGSAAAVAQGIVDLAIGTDTGGSVRIPSALCGVVGFKPAFGTFSLEGVYPLSPTLDHLGLHARSVADIARAFTALVGDQVDNARPTRIGVVSDQLARCEPDVQQAVSSAISSIASGGVEIVEVSLPDPDEVFPISTAIMFPEALAMNRRLIAERGDQLGRDVADRFELGAIIPAHVYFVAIGRRTMLQSRLSQVLGDLDAVIGPTVPLVAPTFDDATGDASLAARLGSLTRLGNVTGAPALSLPLAGADLPIGLQVMSSTNARTLGVASFIEQLTLGSL